MGCITCHKKQIFFLIFIKECRSWTWGGGGGSGRGSTFVGFWGQAFITRSDQGHIHILTILSSNTHTKEVPRLSMDLEQIEKMSFYHKNTQIVWSNFSEFFIFFLGGDWMTKNFGSKFVLHMSTPLLHF